MKKSKFLILIFLIGCVQNNIEGLKSSNEIDQKNMIKYVSIKWKVNNYSIINLTKEVKEKVLKVCKTKKFSLITIDTKNKNEASGKFRCN